MKNKWELFVFAWFGTTPNLAKAMNISYPQAQKWTRYPMLMHVCDITKISKYTGISSREIVEVILESEKRTIKNEGDE
jgi:hypothetical protein